MFDLFKKKKNGVKVIDKIWMVQEAKWKAILNHKRNNPDSVFIFWFADTLRQAESLFQKESLTITDLLVTREIHSSQLLKKQVIFAEHYPLQQKEQEFFAKLNLQDVQIWSALDEPLFKHFGSDKIIQMMKQLGMTEDVAIEHNMISKAIQNAQEKISKKVLIDQAASSQEEWLKKNWAS